MDEEKDEVNIPRVARKPPINEVDLIPNLSVIMDDKAEHENVVPINIEPTKAEKRKKKNILLMKIQISY